MAAAVPAAEPVVIGYWAIRGLAQPIRNLCRYMGIAWKDELFTQGDAPEYSRDEWLKAKDAMADELAYPNLPYMKDGAVRITQSQAIMRYLARTYGAGKGLYEGDAATLAAIDEAMEQAVDLRNAVTRCAYGAYPFAKLRDEMLPGHLAGFERVLGKPGRGPWLAGGEAPTLADFVLTEVLTQLRDMVSELDSGKAALAAYPAVAAYFERWNALPFMAAALADPAYMHRPHNNKIAQWK